MIENKKDDKKQTKGKENKAPKGGKVSEPAPAASKAPAGAAPPTPPSAEAATPPAVNGDGELDEETRQRNLQKLMMRGKKKPAAAVSKSPEPPKSKGKQSTKWENEGSSKDAGTLDFSSAKEDDSFVPAQAEKDLVGKMSAQLQDIEPDDDSKEDDYEEEEEEKVQIKSKAASKSTGGGMFSMFKNLVGSKTLAAENVALVLDKMKDNLIEIELLYSSL